MRGFFKRDISIKIISILFAVVLWFVLNPVNPSVLNIPLNVINESSLLEKELVLISKNFPKYVTITINGRYDNLKASDFEATLDLSKVNSVSDKVLSIDSPTYFGTQNIGASDIEMKPQSVSLELGKIEEQQFQVSIETTGKPKADYEIVSRTVTPQTVTIKRLDSLVQSVGDVKVVVDVTNIDKGIDIKKELKVYNKNGVEMPELSRDLSAQVKIEVGRWVQVKPFIKGTPAKNFVNGKNVVKPEKVLITGAPEVLARTDTLWTEPIDIENADNNINKNSLISLPEGIKLFNTPKQVEVMSYIEQLAQKEFVIPAEIINIENKEIDNSLKYEIQSKSISIIIKGDKNDLDILDLNTLMPSVDVAGLKEGVHQIPLKLVLPGVVKLLQDYTVEVKVSPR